MPRVVIAFVRFAVIAGLASLAAWTPVFEPTGTETRAAGEDVMLDWRSSAQESREAREQR